MKLSLGQAAKQAGISKSTLSRLIKQGKVSAERQDNGTLHIDADPHAERFYLACGALRVGAVPAPLEGEPQRVRPQMALAVLWDGAVATPPH